MQPLPIDAELGRITSLLAKSRALVIVASPGAGKTTRVPPAILGAGLLSGEHANLVMLQPRRVAARAAAQRIADENGWELGREVGYHIRFEKRLTDQTRLRILTEGVLTRQLLSDPFLPGVGCVVLDEFHERSIHSDLAIAMLREMQQTVREDLLLVVMSATLEAEAAAKFLGGAPIVQVPGRLFPVEIEYQPHGHVPIVARVSGAVRDVLSRSEGDVLVFLPGADEIRRVMRNIESTDLAVLPLHGSLPAEQQTLALSPSSKRKIILATNIAETSLTIDGVRVVIDSGLARVPAFDARRGLDHLELLRISKASAEQRAGRAGRTAPGRCIRLWSTKEQAELDDFALPEILRVDLASVVLDLHAWGKPDPATFGWFERPPKEMIDAAMNLLEMIGARTEKGLTALGKSLLKLPVHPRIGRLLYAAAEAGCAQEGGALAALLSEKDILRGDERTARVQADSDLLIRMDYLAETQQREEIDPIALRLARQARAELIPVARKLSHVKGKKPSRETLLKLALWAYPDRVCRRRTGDHAAGVMVGGGGVRLVGSSVVRQAEFFLALDARHDPRSPTREAMVHIASEIRVDWLFEMFPQSIVRERKTVYDVQRQRVVGHGTVRYRDLVLSEDRDAPVDPEQAGIALGAALRPRAANIFASDEKSAQFLARLDLLRRAMSEHAWPTMDEQQLADVLQELCAGKKSLDEVTRQPLAEALESRLVYPMDSLFRQNAPATIEVPTGNQIALAYSMGQPPVLAVRLQEVFGWAKTPRVAGGRVAVRMHLLGPNYRAVQITDDLASFWATTYFQVRKDLRVKYPRHSWPDDPLTAAPQAKGGRRR